MANREKIKKTKMTSNRLPKLRKAIAITAVMAIAMLSLGACGEMEDEAASGETSKSSKHLNSISLAGSTSMEKLCSALGEGFMIANEDISVTTEYTGSSAGIEAAGAGSVDIGNSSRELSEEESAQGLVQNVVAIDGIAVITNKANGVSGLTDKELADIYQGKINSWDELGGSEEKVVIIGREAGSGTRDAFEELLGVTDLCRYAQELDSTGGVIAKVMSIPGAIGYVSLDVVNEEVSALAINKVEPTEANIIEGKYILSRPFVMVTRGTIEEQNPLIQKWFDYIESEDGREIIRKVGLIVPKQEARGDENE